MPVKVHDEDTGTYTRYLLFEDTEVRLVGVNGMIDTFVNSSGLARISVITPAGELEDVLVSDEDENGQYWEIIQSSAAGGVIETIRYDDDPDEPWAIAEHAVYVDGWPWPQHENDKF